MASRFLVSKFSIGAGVCICLLAQPVLAASTLEIPSSISLERNQNRFVPPPSAETKLDAEVPAQFVPEAPPPNADKIHLHLKVVNVRGSSVYSTPVFEALTARLINGDVTLMDLYNVAQEIRAKYLADGYIMTRVLLGKQDLSSGVAEIQVGEFQIHSFHVLIDGAAIAVPPEVASVLAEISNVHPLTAVAANQAMEKLASMPGLRLDSARPPRGGEPQVDIVLEFVSEKASPNSVSIPIQLDPETLPLGSNRTIILNQVNIEGSSVYGDAALRGIYQDLLGKTIKLADIYSLAKKVAARYEADGYVMTEVRVPGQSVINGAVRLEVREFGVDDIKVFVDGQESPPSSMERRIVDHLRGVRPLKDSDVQRVTLLLGDLPGVTVQGLRRSASVPNGSEVLLSRKSLAGGVAWSNSGVPGVGVQMMAVDASEAGLLGFNERITINQFHPVNHPNQINGVGAAVEVPLTSDGTSFNSAISHTVAQPQGDIRSFDPRMLGTTLSMGLTSSFLRSPSENFKGTARFTTFDNNTTALNEQVTVKKDSIRALRIGSSYDFSDTALGNPAVTRIATEMHQGLNVMGASGGDRPFTSRGRGDENFKKVTLDADRNQQLGGAFAMMVGVMGQYAFDRLPASEEFGFGGASYGRGYDSGAIAGDQGIAAKSELQYNRPLGLPFLTAFQAFVFYDFGYTWNSYGLDSSEANSAAAASTGIGLRTVLTEWLSSELMVAKPLTLPLARNEAEGTGKDPNFLFSLSARF